MSTGKSGPLGHLSRRSLLAAAAVVVAVVLPARRADADEPAQPTQPRRRSVECLADLEVF